MKDAQTKGNSQSIRDLNQMHEVYRKGGQELRKAPHVVYAEGVCPHPRCGQPMHAVDFRLEEHGKEIHDRLVRAWWSDTGFAGRCPRCRGWIHFTIRAKRAISAQEAAGLSQLPDDWHVKAIIL